MIVCTVLVLAAAFSPACPSESFAWWLPSGPTVVCLSGAVPSCLRPPDGDEVLLV